MQDASLNSPQVVSAASSLPVLGSVVVETIPLSAFADYSLPSSASGPGIPSGPPIYLTTLRLLI